jgi:hypothetical protein
MMSAEPFTVMVVNDEPLSRHHTWPLITYFRPTPWRRCKHSISGLTTELSKDKTYEIDEAK